MIAGFDHNFCQVVAGSVPPISGFSNTIRGKDAGTMKLKRKNPARLKQFALLNAS